MPLIVSHCVGVALWLRNTIDQLKHMLVLLYRRSRIIIIIILYTRDKGENFKMLVSVENESVLGYESGSEPILLPDFSTNPGPNRFFYLNQILKSL